VTFPLVLLTEALQRGVLVGDGVVEARVLAPCELKRESLTALASATACLRMSQKHTFSSRMTRYDSTSLVFS